MGGFDLKRSLFAGVHDVKGQNTFIREYVDDGTVKVMFVPSLENKADIFTKNINTKLLSKKAHFVPTLISYCLRICRSML